MSIAVNDPPLGDAHGLQVTSSSQSTFQLGIAAALISSLPKTRTAARRPTCTGLSGFLSVETPPHILHFAFIMSGHPNIISFYTKTFCIESDVEFCMFKIFLLL